MNNWMVFDLHDQQITKVWKRFTLYFKDVTPRKQAKGRGKKEVLYLMHLSSASTRGGPRANVGT
jgi:hypothetical protein